MRYGQSYDQLIEVKQDGALIAPSGAVADGPAVIRNTSQPDDGGRLRAIAGLADFVSVRDLIISGRYAAAEVFETHRGWNWRNVTARHSGRGWSLKGSDILLEGCKALDIDQMVNDSDPTYYYGGVGVDINPIPKRPVRNITVRNSQFIRCKARRSNGGVDGGALEIGAKADVDGVTLDGVYAEDCAGFAEIGGNSEQRPAIRNVVIRNSIIYQCGKLLLVNHPDGTFAADYERGAIWFDRCTFVQLDGDLSPVWVSDFGGSGHMIRITRCVIEWPQGVDLCNFSSLDISDSLLSQTAMCKVSKDAPSQPLTVGRNTVIGGDGLCVDPANGDFRLRDNLRTEYGHWGADAFVCPDYVNDPPPTPTPEPETPAEPLTIDIRVTFGTGWRDLLATLFP